MPDPGGSDLGDLIDAVDPVVDAALAEAFGSVVAYRSAIAEVRSAAGAYYGGPDLVMDDAAYDALMARVAATEAAHPQWKLAQSPTEAIAAGAGVVGDVEHSTPMLSLDNVFDEDTLRRWAARLQRLLGRPAGGFTVEPKIDGLAVAARYVDGQLALVATRGDGRAGEDVTGQARRAAGLPARLAEPLTVEVRGEVFMTDADFAEAQVMRTGHGEPSFAHPRSAAAGTLRAQDRRYDAPLSRRCTPVVARWASAWTGRSSRPTSPPTGRRPASPAGHRGGVSPTSSPPTPAPPGCCASRCRSAGPASSPRSQCWNRSWSAGSRSPRPPCTTSTTCSAATSVPVTRCSCAGPVTSSRRSPAPDSTTGRPMRCRSNPRPGVPAAAATSTGHRSGGAAPGPGPAARTNPSRTTPPGTRWTSKDSATRSSTCSSRRDW